MCVIHNYQPERFEFIAANVLAGHQLVNVTCVWARVLVVSHMHGGRFIVFMRMVYQCNVVSYTIVQLNPLKIFSMAYFSSWAVLLSDIMLQKSDEKRVNDQHENEKQQQQQKNNPSSMASHTHSLVPKPVIIFC